MVMGGLLVAHTTAWVIYKRHGWKLPRLLPFPRLEVYFAMFMLAPLATCAGRTCCTSHAMSCIVPCTSCRPVLPHLGDAVCACAHASCACTTIQNSARSCVHASTMIGCAV